MTMTAEPDPIGNDARNARRVRKLPAGAACALCGTTESTALEKVDRRKVPHLLEAHHAGGHHNDEALVVVLCRNCHARATAAQWDAGALAKGKPPTALHQLAQLLRSLASFFALLAHCLFSWAEWMAVAIACLDASFPGWGQLLPEGP